MYASAPKTSIWNRLPCACAPLYDLRAAAALLLAVEAIAPEAALLALVYSPRRGPHEAAWRARPCQPPSSERLRDGTRDARVEMSLRGRELAAGVLVCALAAACSKTTPGEPVPAGSAAPVGS